MANRSDIMLFTGTAHPELANEISEILQIPLGKCNVGKFSDGEISVNINETVRGKDAYIIQPTGNPVNDNLMELCIMIDALKRASIGHINAVIPYYGYARQDRKAKPRDPISAKLVADILSAAGADDIITMDLHASQIQGYFNIPVNHLQGMPVLAKYFLDKNFASEDIVIVSPDHGSVTRARNFAHYFNCPIAIIDKRRPKPNVSEVMNIIGDVKDKICILVDDMVDTAGTITNAADALAAMGSGDVYAAATHPILSGPALDRISKSAIKEMILLNTIPIPEEKRIGKIKVLSVAPLFAETIRRVSANESISILFE